jgi:hypothetical protein
MKKVGPADERRECDDVFQKPKLHCFTLLSKAAKKRRLSQGQPKKLVKKLRLSSPKIFSFLMTGTHCTYFY